ncbi:MAG TPA: ParA family protein [Bryobacteraceae bacterium]
MATQSITEFGGQAGRLLLNLVGYTPRQPAAVISVLNLKGGCGKSTIAVNLACELASGGEKVLLIDNDAQGTARHWWTNGRLPLKGEFMPLENDEDGERMVRAAAARQERYLVLDAPAHVTAATLAASKIADLVLIPITASGIDLVATEAAVELVRQARALRRSGSPRCLIVPSKIDRRTDAGRQIDQRLQGFGEPVGPAIHQKIAFVEAFGAGQWIGEYAPQSAAHYDIASLAIAVKRSLRI